MKACSGGFEGKGFKFNEQEASEAESRKKLQKAAFGLHVDSDEEDEDVDVSGITNKYIQIYTHIINLIL